MKGTPVGGSDPLVPGAGRALCLSGEGVSKMLDALAWGGLEE